MKTYYIGIDLDSSVEARTQEEALNIAQEMIKNKCYSLHIVDEE